MIAADRGDQHAAIPRAAFIGNHGVTGGAR
jgi:hypothetical protein